MSEGVYLYGLVHASEEKHRDAVGLKNREVSAVPFAEIAAIVSAWDENVVMATIENCLAHDRVLCRLVKTETILPFEFGTIAPERDRVIRILEHNYSQLKRALLKLNGMVEVNVTALWHDMEAIFEGIVRGHPLISRYKREIMAKSYERTYNDRLKIGQMVAEQLERKRRLEGERLYKEIKGNAVDGCQLVVARSLSEQAIFAAAFLVKRDLYPDFERGLMELGRFHDGRIDFKYTDMVPPYNFVDVRIKV